MAKLTFKTAYDMIGELDGETYAELSKKYDLEKLKEIIEFCRIIYKVR